MKKAIMAIAAASLAIGGSAMAAPTQAEKGEARLAEMLEGRVAGEPQSCIPALSDRRLEVIDETAIVYDAGDTIYVARPSDPQVLDSSDILVIERFGSQLCKHDVSRTVDRHTGFVTGIVFLDDFVPYKEG